MAKDEEQSSKEPQGPLESQESQNHQNRETTAENGSSCARPEWVNDPDQIELSKILRSAVGTEGRNAPHMLPCKDGVMRSFNEDQTVRDAVGLTPDQIRCWLRRRPGKWADPSFYWGKDGEIPDGTQVPEQKWFNPDPSLVPAPTSAEWREESRRATEAGPEARRAWLNEKMQEEIKAGRWWHD